MRRLALGGAVLLVAAAVITSAAVAPRRERSAAEARLPSAGNPAAHGLAAAATWLAATGREAVVIGPLDPAPRAGDVWVLAAPAAPVPDGDAAAFLAHARRGGLSIWALGPAPQPALERALGAARLPGGGERVTSGLGAHPLLSGLALPASRHGVTSSAPGARAATGPEEPPTAVSVPLGRGEVLLLAGLEPLENAHVDEVDALSLWVRLAGRGRVAFDERWLEPRSAASPGGLPLLLGAQALLAAVVLLLALGLRHGAIRPAPAAGSLRTARDYLASLASLSRRAGAEPELAGASWRRLRGLLEREAGVPARLPDDEAARRLEARAPAAAAALRRGAGALAAPGPGQLLAVSQAAADVEGALRRPTRPLTPPRPAGSVGR